MQKHPSVQLTHGEAVCEDSRVDCPAGDHPTQDVRGVQCPGSTDRPEVWAELPGAAVCVARCTAQVVPFTWTAV